jgi:hypothetical protein
MIAYVHAHSHTRLFGKAFLSLYATWLEIMYSYQTLQYLTNKMVWEEHLFPLKYFDLHDDASKYCKLTNSD